MCLRYISQKQSTVQQQYYAELLMSSKGNLSDSLQLLRVCFTHLHTFIGNLTVFDKIVLVFLKNCLHIWEVT